MPPEREPDSFGGRSVRLVPSGDAAAVPHSPLARPCPRQVRRDGQDILRHVPCAMSRTRAFGATIRFPEAISRSLSSWVTGMQRSRDWSSAPVSHAISSRSPVRIATSSRAKREISIRIDMSSGQYQPFQLDAGQNSQNEGLACNRLASPAFLDRGLRPRPLGPGRFVVPRPSSVATGELCEMNGRGSLRRPLPSPEPAIADRWLSPQPLPSGRGRAPVTSRADG